MARSSKLKSLNATNIESADQESDMSGM
jgi:hypothetical protein